MRADSVITQIEEAFQSRQLEIQKDALTIGFQICMDIGLNAEELAEQWDVFSMNNQFTGAANSSQMMSLKSKLVQGKKKSLMNPNSSSSKNSNSSRTPNMKRNITQMSTTMDQESITSIYGVELNSPQMEKKKQLFSSPSMENMKGSKRNVLFSPKSFQSPIQTDYANRKDAGTTVDEFNPHLKKITKPNLESKDENSSEKQVLIEYSDDLNTPSDFSYMYTPLPERARALDRQVEEFQQYFMKMLNLEELGVVGDPSPATVVVVGRICCESPEGKLNPAVIQLEGSKRSCGGQRVLLELSNLELYSLFPGQIVAVEGIYNNVNGPMVVRKLYDSCPAPMSKSLLDDGGNRFIKVIASSGPYTCSSDVDYRPLADLMEVVKIEEPDVLILMGPFVDVSHPSFSNGVTTYEDILVSFEDVFLMRVVAHINKLFRESFRTHVILIPALSDAHHDFVYPQPPFVQQKIYEILEDRSFEKRLHLMSNPATFQLNGIVFGASTIDSIFQLGLSELHRSKKSQQPRLIRLTQHMIHQRSFYPLFPPPITGDAPVDIRFQSKFTFQHTPDILISPSMLNRFCGKINDSLCINPGQLSKGKGGGTYSIITIHPNNESNMNTKEKPNNNNIPSRTCVVIKKI